MNKVKTFFGKIQNNMKTVVKSIIYAIATATFGYGIWYAIKNTKNGHGFLINFIAGIIHGVGKVIAPAISVAISDKNVK